MRLRMRDGLIQTSGSLKTLASLRHVALTFLLQKDDGLALHYPQTRRPLCSSNPGLIASYHHWSKTEKYWCQIIWRYAQVRG